MRANPSAFERNDHDSSTPAALIQISIAHIDRSGAKRYNPPPQEEGGRTPKRPLTAAPNDTKIPLKRRGTHAKTTAYGGAKRYKNPPQEEGDARQNDRLQRIVDILR